MQSATGLSGRGRHRAPWKERVAGTNAAEPRNRGNENDGYAEMLLAARPLHAVSVTAFSSIPSLLPFLGFPCPYCPRSRRTTTKRAQSLDVLGLGESFDQSPLSLHTERQTDHPPGPSYVDHVQGCHYYHESMVARAQATQRRAVPVPAQIYLLP